MSCPAHHPASGSLSDTASIRSWTVWVSDTDTPGFHFEQPSYFEETTPIAPQAASWRQRGDLMATPSTVVGTQWEPRTRGTTRETEATS